MILGAGVAIPTGGPICLLSVHNAAHRRDTRGCLGTDRRPTATRGSVTPQRSAYHTAHSALARAIQLEDRFSEALRTLENKSVLQGTNGPENKAAVDTRRDPDFILARTDAAR
jgi:hypothetical protein